MDLLLSAWRNCNETKFNLYYLPQGLRNVAQIQGEKVTVTGNTCPKGEEYAINECLHPVRTVTATVRVANRSNTMASVKTAQPISKERMMDVMAQLRKITVNAPVSVGQVILEDVSNTQILITKNID